MSSMTEAEVKREHPHLYSESEWRRIGRGGPLIAGGFPKYMVEQIADLAEKCHDERSDKNDLTWLGIRTEVFGSKLGKLVQESVGGDDMAAEEITGMAIELAKGTPNAFSRTMGSPVKESYRPLLIKLLKNDSGETFFRSIVYSSHWDDLLRENEKRKRSEPYSLPDPYAAMAGLISKTDWTRLAQADYDWKGFDFKLTHPVMNDTVDTFPETWQSKREVANWLVSVDIQYPYPPQALDEMGSALVPSEVSALSEGATMPLTKLLGDMTLEEGTVH